MVQSWLRRGWKVREIDQGIGPNFLKIWGECLGETNRFNSIWNLEESTLEKVFPEGIKEAAAATWSEEKGQPGSMGFFAGLTPELYPCNDYATNADFTKNAIMGTGYKMCQRRWIRSIQEKLIQKASTA